jgi:hypothetical protein
MGIWYKDTRVSLSQNTSQNIAGLLDVTVDYCFQNISFDSELLKVAEEEYNANPWFGSFKPMRGDLGYKRLLLQHYASVYWEATGEWPTAGY